MLRYRELDLISLEETVAPGVTFEVMFAAPTQGPFLNVPIQLDELLNVGEIASDESVRERALARIFRWAEDAAPNSDCSDLTILFNKTTTFTQIRYREKCCWLDNESGEIWWKPLPNEDYRKMPGGLLV